MTNSKIEKLTIYVVNGKEFHNELHAKFEQQRVIFKESFDNLSDGLYGETSLGEVTGDGLVDFIDENFDFFETYIKERNKLLTR